MINLSYEDLSKRVNGSEGCVIRSLSARALDSSLEI